MLTYHDKHLIDMDYKMTPAEYFKQIIGLYEKARSPSYYNPNILRGRSASISSQLEDLTALFIALNNPHTCSYYIDQPMRFEGTTTKYPDIVIQKKNGGIDHLVDVKTDIGWNRNKMYDFCREWEGRIESIKGSKTTFKLGVDKQIKEGTFSENLKYHILIISLVNSGKQIIDDYKRVLDDCSNVKLYVLSDKVHPNNYKYTSDEVLENIAIKSEEFERFFAQIVA